MAMNVKCNGWFFLAMVAMASLWTSCSSREWLEKANAEGRITARYQVDKKSGLRMGTFKSYYEDGQVFEESQYVQDTLDGIRRLYHPNGMLMIEETYQKGLFEGPYKSWYADGTPESEGQYADNTMSGLWKRFYPNGQLYHELTFRDNLENGPFRTWHPNGKLMEEGGYLDGDNLHGTFKIYDENGVHVRTMEYERGRGKVIWTLEGAMVPE
jgi:antitoxin component YwqK of YwqJK toxin-antitoxin module